MIGPEGAVKVLVATKPVDFRKGAEGLAALVKAEMRADPFSGAVYVFRAKRADRIKLIFWDGTGLCLYAKRLEDGQFRWPKVQDGTMRLTSKLIDGTFPDYDRVIPRGNDKILRVDKKDFNDAVGRVSAISQEKHRPVKLSLAKDLLVISAASPEQGTASEELGSDLVDYQFGPLEIGFQARYLSDVTEQIRGKVEFIFADGAAPTLVRDQDDSSAVYVLMPMRV